MHTFSKIPSTHHPISSCHLRTILSLSIMRVRRKNFSFSKICIDEPHEYHLIDGRHPQTIYGPSAHHPISSRRASKTQKNFFRAAYKFLNFCRTLSTVNISEMAQVLTRQNLRSTRFLRNEMFSCTQSGAEDPTDEDWMHTLHESIVIENGIKLGITDAERVFQVIEPFAERLFRTTFYHRKV